MNKLYEIVEKAKQLGAEEIKNRIYYLILKNQNEDRNSVSAVDLLNAIDKIDWEAKHESQIENETNDLIENQ